MAVEIAPASHDQGQQGGETQGDEDDRLVARLGALYLVVGLGDAAGAGVEIVQLGFDQGMLAQHAQAAQGLLGTVVEGGKARQRQAEALLHPLRHAIEAPGHEGKG